VISSFLHRKISNSLAHFAAETFLYTDHYGRLSASLEIWGDHGQFVSLISQWNHKKLNFILINSN